MSAGSCEWVSRQDVRDFFDRLKWPGHPDYDLILEIEDQLAEHWEADDRASEACVTLEEIRELCANAGIVEPDDKETELAPLLRMFLPVD